jgi:putative oxidoreductase
LTSLIDSHSLTLVGRLLIGGLFVIGVINHFFVFPIMVRQIAERGVPFPGPALIAGSMFQVIAGLVVMLGWFVAIAAGSLIGFTFISSCMLMNFWNMSGEKRMSAMDGWTSNLGVIGGLLIVAALA